MEYLYIALFFITTAAFSQEVPTESATETSNDAIYNSVEVRPDFPGGMQAFYKYVSENYNVPKSFKGNGKLIGQFVIEKDGTLTEIKILRDIGFGTGKELTRILKNSPKWTPGIQNGRPVRVLYTLPIALSEK